MQVQSWIRSPGEGNGNPLQNSCLENPMDKGTWPATVHRVTKSWTRLKRLGMHVITGGGSKEKRKERGRYSGDKADQKL